MPDGYNRSCRGILNNRVSAWWIQEVIGSPLAFEEDPVCSGVSYNVSGDVALHPEWRRVLVVESLLRAAFEDAAFHVICLFTFGIACGDDKAAIRLR